MGRAKTIEMLLMDGRADGRVKCSLPGNWVGKVYKIPRESIELGKTRKDLNQSGVYFLFGKTPEGKPEVYVGQAVERKNGHGITQRLLEHKKPSEDYWTEAVVLTTSDNSFGPTEVSYLEHKFYQMAVDAVQYEVHNANDPNAGNVSEEKEAELESHVENTLLIIATLGYKVFTKNSGQKAPVVSTDKNHHKVHCFSQSNDADANGICTEDGKIIVLKGSRVSDKISPSFEKQGHGFYLKRKSLEKEGTIKDRIFRKDYKFSSLSAAAAVVLGRSANGRTEWKTEDGRDAGTLLK